MFNRDGQGPEDLSDPGDRPQRTHEGSVLREDSCLDHPHRGPELVVFSKEISLSFPHSPSPFLLREKIKAFLMNLTNTLREDGCQLIGHIKVLVKSGTDGYYFMSTTSFDQIPECKGEIEKGISNLSLTIHVIVYGLSEDRLNFLVSRKIEKIGKFLEA
jgi:hypothetical protein